uniref:Peptidase S1 domain-containing protein n=1 Tax=Anopheles arabiensis TaxID=7173 RepID=A0A8W7MU05_ANOAR
MKQVICLVVFGLFACSTILTIEDFEAKATLRSVEAVKSGRIVNGTRKDISKYKFMAIVYIQKEYVCSASIVSGSHALTAAHCVYFKENDPSSVTIRGGSSDIFKGGNFIPSNQNNCSPNYMRTGSIARDVYDNDVAVLTVATNAFVGKPNIAPISFATSAELPSGTRCYALGWGRTNFDENLSTKLLYAEFRIVLTADCRKAYSGKANITPNVICGKAKNSEVCEGDSGGPLVCDNKLTGITFFVYGTCKGILPAGFTKIMSPSIRLFIRIVTKL